MSDGLDAPPADGGLPLAFSPARPTSPTGPEQEMKMQGVEIQDYARQLFEAHGARAAVEAAQKARSLEENGQGEEARTWRRIEAIIREMLGPHAS
jgi:hypothetical protein